MEINKEIEKIMKVRILFHQSVFLLHEFRGLRRKQHEILLAYILLAASLIIAGYWNSEKIPSIYEWRQKKMYHTFLMAST